MVPIDLKSLVGRLSAIGRRQLEAAAGLTLSRSHYNVEIEHWLVKLIEASDTDVSAILRHFEIDAGRRQLLLEGIDDIDLALARAADIAAFQRRQLQDQPWLA